MTTGCCSVQPEILRRLTFVKSSEIIAACKTRYPTYKTMWPDLESSCSFLLYFSEPKATTGVLRGENWEHHHLRACIRYSTYNCVTPSIQKWIHESIAEQKWQQKPKRRGKLIREWSLICISKDFQHPPERTDKASSMKISDLTAQMLLIQAKEEISHSRSEDELGLISEQEPFSCAAQLL